MEIPKAPKIFWGKTRDGESVDLHALTNSKGSEARIATYGGVVVSLKVPDRSGRMGDVVAGFNDLESYLKPPPYFGAIIGRYGNRIGKARFSLDGGEYTLAKNDGENSLHGGNRGFDKRVWTARSLSFQTLELSYLSRDREEGYPGNLRA
ncbi:MAG: galactose-1-epimerase, partial [Bryobacterales bacterium]|nr:galactose-1-epimerase [Bryobacterales bacterium]